MEQPVHYKASNCAKTVGYVRSEFSTELPIPRYGDPGNIKSVAKTSIGASN